MGSAFALELAPFRIRVNLVSLGFVETALTANCLQNERFVRAIEKNTALKRVASPKKLLM